MFTFNPFSRWVITFQFQHLNLCFRPENNLKYCMLKIAHINIHIYIKCEIF